MGDQDRIDRLLDERERDDERRDVLHRETLDQMATQMQHWQALCAALVLLVVGIVGSGLFG